MNRAIDFFLRFLVSEVTSKTGKVKLLGPRGGGGVSCKRGGGGRATWIQDHKLGRLQGYRIASRSLTHIVVQIIIVNADLGVTQAQLSHVSMGFSTTLVPVSGPRSDREVPCLL